jgi:glycosyltransferase involved in cell wall biosynthesis
MTGSLAIPTISVVMAMFNEQPAIAIESLQSVADQTFADFECIIVDESKSQATIEACEAFCAADPRFRRVIPETRLGLAGSLNMAISLSSGRFIARFDSDDVCLPDRLATQLAFLETTPEVDVLGGWLEVIDADGHLIATRQYASEHEDIVKASYFKSPMAHPTVIMRRTAIDKVGVYDPGFLYSEDLELWLRMIRQGLRLHNLPRPLVRYRQTLTRRDALHWKYNLRARKKHWGGHALFRQSLGMGIIAGWSLVPPALQETVYRQLVFMRQGSRRAI